MNKNFNKILILAILILLGVIFSSNSVLAYQDIGLRVFDGTKIVSITVEDTGTLTSPLRIAKNGTIYGIILVDPSDPCASKIRIQTSLGTKALRSCGVQATETNIPTPTNRIRRLHNCCLEILVILKFRGGVKKDDIVDAPLTLYSYSPSCSGSIQSSSHFILGLPDRPQVHAWFNTVSFLNLTAPYIGGKSLFPGYGEFKVRVAGRLKSGQCFYGEGIILIW